MRGFEIIAEGGTMPVRGTAKSAGYDFCAREDCVIPARGTGLVRTGVTAFMAADEWLMLKARSSLALKKHLIAGAGVVDADYYPQEIGFVIHNHSDQDFLVKAGERIGQGIFLKYLLAQEDEAQGARDGGFGSTGSR